MCELYRGGQTLQEIGAQFGITRERVRQIIVAAGVSRLQGGVHAQAKSRARQKLVAKKNKRDARALLIYGCDYKTLKELNHGCLLRAPSTPAWAYLDQRRNAEKRGIQWAITFPQWMEIWLASGHLYERGRGRDRYCMARCHDRGAYALGNVYITTIAQNVSDYQSELKRRGVKCVDGWRRLPESAHHVSPTPHWSISHKGAPKGLGLGRGRGWTFNHKQTRRPYQVTCAGKYVGCFATQQQAELAYRMACNELLKEHAA
jgi:hypothetical protein